MSIPKIEVCLTILQVLNIKGQLNADRIASKAKISPSLLGECISILAEQGMLEKKEHNVPVYCISESGKRVLSFFKLGSILECKKVLRAQE